VTVLAAVAASKSPSAWDEPGTLGFLVVFGMAVILYFVFRSLAKQLRKVNEAARLDAERADAERAAGADGAGAVTGPAAAARAAAIPPNGEHPAGDTVIAPATDGSRPLAQGKIIGPPAGNGASRSS
jgi:hypothetical protein